MEWKLMCSLPFWLIQSHSRVGKAELCDRFDRFNSNHWDRVHEAARRQASKWDSRNGDRPDPNVDERARAAWKKIQLGEVSRARHCLTGPLDLATEATFSEMQNKRPRVASRETHQAVLDFEPEEAACRANRGLRNPSNHLRANSCTRMAPWVELAAIARDIRQPAPAHRTRSASGGGGADDACCCSASASNLRSASWMFTLMEARFESNSIMCPMALIFFSGNGLSQVTEKSKTEGHIRPSWRHSFTTWAHPRSPPRPARRAFALAN